MGKRLSMFMVILVGSALISGVAYSSWAYAFVVNDGKIYIITDHQVDAKQIGKRIGAVTKHSDREGTYSGNFSNHYPRGTKYYEIIDVDVNEAIAIQANKGVFMKANYGGEYAGGKWNEQEVLPYVIGALILLTIGLLLYRGLRRRAA